jgi:hypothetical protein
MDILIILILIAVALGLIGVVHAEARRLRRPTQQLQNLRQRERAAYLTELHRRHAGARRDD